MNKQQLIHSMEKATGKSVITRSQLADYLNLKDAKSVDVHLTGLPSVNQRFFIPDVAENILNNCKWE